MASQVRKIIFFATLLTIGSLIWYFESQKPDTEKIKETLHIQKMGKEEKAKMYDSAIELVGTQQFINSEPFKLADFIGKKVILVDFWTYSCINCQRTTPYLNAWWDRYNKDGLLIVGVHTPEFEFEKKYDNVLRATNNLGIKYPVVQDNNYSTWRAYNNRYWPRKYLIDIDGYIVYDHIGEGAYEETENKIRELLAERKITLGESGTIAEEMANPENIQDVSVRVGSPEVYFGASRNDLLANGTQSRVGIQNLSQPSTISKNNLYLVGSWDIQEEYAKNIKSNARVIFKFEARRVNIVSESDKPARIKIIVDGKELKSVTVQSSQLYELLNLPQVGEHILELLFEDPEIKIYTFTFG